MVVLLVSLVVYVLGGIIMWMIVPDPEENDWYEEGDVFFVSFLWPFTAIPLILTWIIMKILTPLKKIKNKLHGKG